MIVAQISDLHVKPEGRLAYRFVDTARCLERAVARLVALDPRPDLVIATGDLTDGGTPAEYARLRELLAPLPMPYYLAMGNHDVRDALRAAFPDHAYLREDGTYVHYVVAHSNHRVSRFTSGTASASSAISRPWKKPPARIRSAPAAS